MENEKKVKGEKVVKSTRVGRVVREKEGVLV